MMTTTTSSSSSVKPPVRRGARICIRVSLGLTDTPPYALWYLCGDGVNTPRKAFFAAADSPRRLYDPANASEPHHGACPRAFPRRTGHPDRAGRHDDLQS